MIDLTKEGKQFIVFIKDGSNTYQTAFLNWNDVESFIATSTGVYKIVSMECYDIPLTGLRLAVP
jgi:hypothetical protein